MTAVTFNLPPAIVRDLRDKEHAEGLTHAAAIMVAYEGALHQLEDLVINDTNDHPPAEDPEAEDLSPFRIPLPRPGRREGAPKEQLGTRLPARTLEAIDQAVETSGARDRSHLTALVLRHWLSS